MQDAFGFQQLVGAVSHKPWGPGFCAAWSPAQKGLVLARCYHWNPYQGISPRFLCHAKAVSQLQWSPQTSLD